MNKAEFLYLLPYVISLALSLGITVYVWEHRRVQGANAYAILTTAQTLIIIGFVLELTSPSLHWKIIWDKVQWVFDAIASLAIPYFAIQYSEYKLPKPKLVWSLAGIVPALLFLGVLTDPWLHLIYPNPTLNNTLIFGELLYDFTWFVDLFAAYSYLVIFLAFIILARRVVHPQRFYRAQVTAVIIGLLIPVLGTLLSILNIHITQLRDATPITSAVGNLIIAWSIFRYHWLDIVHIARDKVVENMTDLVFVLDAQDRIIDINQSALDVLNLKPSEAIGKPAEPIFSKWPLVIETFIEPANANREVIVDRAEKHIHYDVKSTLLYNYRGEYQGRIFVARDITPYASLQQNLRDLNEDLEQRVQMRTKELAAAYDTTLEGWAKALELRDKETEGHSRSVTETTFRLAALMNVPQDQLVHIRRGALLHDIGKMGIPDEILRKPGSLTPAELKIVEAHPEIARRLLSPIEYLQLALEIPYYHHERWNGSGYPNGLKGNEIPLSARIFAVVDVWDAMRSTRPYHAACSDEDALAYLQDQSGKLFDPEVVAAFLRLYHQG